MADQNITALPAKTASQMAATDYLLGIDSAEGYRMLIQDLGDYIIQHATSSLAGANQTLAAAVNALNSNSVAKRGTLNSASIDLDDYTSPGVWLCTNIVTNVPVNKYGELIVTASGPASQEVFQRFYTIEENPVCYIRQRNSNSWNSWTKLPTRTEVDTLNSKLSGTTYREGSVLNILVSLPAGIRMVTFTTNCTDKPNGTDYIVGIATVFSTTSLGFIGYANNSNIYAINKISDVWSSWKQIA